ncbi:alpha-crystallin HspX [Kribbella koreensis]|uniref:Alpha-crystallin HspX n=1 Tax=Kribbella koreensis TaxID=57909 RepID=A0ABN1PRT7_9ACTN
MNDLVKRERPLTDLTDWLEVEFAAFPTFRPFTIPALRPFAGLQMMRVEDFREGDDYVLRAELPGIDPVKDVDITVADGMLTVKAERKETTKEALRSEFRYGAFSRSMTLPADFDDSEIKATYKDGILEIRVPLKEVPKPEPKHVDVKTT